jgi:adenylate cyclase
MIAAYRGQDWTAAEACLHELIAHKPDRKLYQFYLMRVQQYQQAPPPEGWDGVCIFTTK